jgi:hypothetical protein
MNIRQICRFYNVGFFFEGKYYRYYRLNRIFFILLIPVAHLKRLNCTFRLTNFIVN